MKHDIAFILPILDNNIECTVICNTISELINHNKNNQICILNDVCEKIDTLNIPMLTVDQGKYLEGNIFVFDLLSLLISKSFVKTNTVYYYATNIPWKDNPQQQYVNWKNLFDDNKLKIIGKNKIIHEIFNIVWNNSIGYCEEFNYEKLHKLL